MVRVLGAAVDLEGVPDADRLLAIPRGVVQPWRRQDGARRHHRQVHVAVRVALHRVRVRETFGVRSSVAAIEANMTVTINYAKDVTNRMQYLVQFRTEHACAALGRDFFAESLVRDICNVTCKSTTRDGGADECATC